MVASHVSRFRLFVLVLLLVPPVPSAAAQAVPDSRQQLRELEAAIRKIASQMRAATVSLRIGSARASGIVLPRGFVLTAAHATERIGQQASVQTHDGVRHAASVHAIDRSADVALLRWQPPPNVVEARLRPEPIRRTERVLALGYPLGSRQSPGQSALRLGRVVSGKVLQSTCRLARGDSGGPLFDLQGRVVGVHRQIRRSVDANFHTSSLSVLERLPQLERGVLVERAANDVTPAAIGTERFDAQLEQARLAVLCDGKPVCQATVIDAADGLVLTKASELFGRITVGRAADRAEAHVIATDRATDLALLKTELACPRGVTFDADWKPETGSLLLSPRLGRTALGVISFVDQRVPRERGEAGFVLDDALGVTQVHPNSAAAKAGLRVGDTLLKVDGTEVSSLSGVRDALVDANAGDRIDVKLQRNGQSLRVTLQLLHAADRRFADKTFQMGAGGRSSTRRTGFSSVIGHDALLQVRDCGGPVENLSGACVGMNIARVGRHAVYMIPAAQIHQALGRMRKSNAHKDLRAAH